MDERKGSSIINGAEAMWHHAGLSNGFWIYTVKAPIIWANYKTLKELWSREKLDISHLRVFGCLAWVHILKKQRHKLKPTS